MWEWKEMLHIIVVMVFSVWFDMCGVVHMITGKL